MVGTDLLTKCSDIKFKPPTVTVQMPVFNGENYLADAIQSILSQTYKDFEFIIIDDGSTDDSLNIINCYAHSDARIHVVSRENRGLGTTQQELVQLAQGEYIAQMDQDDISLPNRLELQVEFLESNPKVVVLGGACELIDSFDRYITTLKMPLTNYDIQSHILGGHGAIAHPSAMMRSTHLKLIGGYNTKLNTAMDLDLWLRMGEVGELGNCNDVLLKYRLHDKSVSEKFGDIQRDEARQACEDAWERRNITYQFSADELWRPGPDRASQHKFMLKYGWWAWNSRQRGTALFYGCKAIRARPFSMAGWMLLIVSLIKRKPAEL